jgi:hypothetical protein
LAPLPGDVKIQPDQIAIFKNVTPRKSLCRQTNCMFERSGTRRPDFAFSGGLPVHRSHGPNAPHPVASPQMSFGYMSCKDAGAKQADEYRDRFNHLMDYPLCWKNARLIADRLRAPTRLSVTPMDCENSAIPWKLVKRLRRILVSVRRGYLYFEKSVFG